MNNIGSDAFIDTQLNSISIPDSVMSLGDGTFARCYNLTKFNIGKNIETIGSSVLEECNCLTTISVSKDNQKYDSRNNCNAIIETESNTLIQGCNATIIPNSIIEIGEYSFSYFNVDTVVIPDSVKRIGVYAFGESSLTSVTIPNSIESIDESAFKCMFLTSITFNGTTNEWYTISSTITNPWKPLTQTDTIHCTDGDICLSVIATIYSEGDSETTQIINHGADIYGGILGSLIIDGTPSNFTEGDVYEEYLANGEHTIRYELFQEIPSNFFANISCIKELVIPNTISIIRENAFDGCDNLETVTIGENLSYIEPYAFSNCNNLTKTAQESPRASAVG